MPGRSNALIGSAPNALRIVELSSQTNIRKFRQSLTPSLAMEGLPVASAVNKVLTFILVRIRVTNENQPMLPGVVPDSQQRE